LAGAGASAAKAVCVSSDGATASATGSVMVDLRNARREVAEGFSFIDVDGVLFTVALDWADNKGI